MILEFKLVEYPVIDKNGVRGYLADAYADDEFVGMLNIWFFDNRELVRTAEETGSEKRLGRKLYRKHIRLLKKEVHAYWLFNQVRNGGTESRLCNGMNTAKTVKRVIKDIEESAVEFAMRPAGVGIKQETWGPVYPAPICPRELNRAKQSFSVFGFLQLLWQRLGFVNGHNN